MKFSGKFSVSCCSYTYDAYMVCHSSIEDRFQTFADSLMRRYELEWWQELYQEYLFFMHDAVFTRTCDMQILFFGNMRLTQ